VANQLYFFALVIDTFHFLIFTSCDRDRNREIAIFDVLSRIYVDDLHVHSACSTWRKRL